MRRFLRVLATLLAFLVVTGASVAQTVTLRAPVDLRARPGSKSPVSFTVLAGEDLDVLGAGRAWTPVAFRGQRFYAPAAQIAAATPSNWPGSDPTCDYGYPYSGSGLYFTHPLTGLRHSEPLGFLFGYHRFYPC